MSLSNSVFFARLQLVVIAATAQHLAELADLNRVPDPDGLTGSIPFEMRAQTLQLNDACVKRLGVAKVDPWH